MGALKNTPYVLLQIFLVALAWISSSQRPGVFSRAAHGAAAGAEPHAPAHPRTGEATGGTSRAPRRGHRRVS